MVTSRLVSGRDARLRIIGALAPSIINLNNIVVAFRNDGHKPTTGKWPRRAMMDFVKKSIKTQNHRSFDPLYN